MLAGRGPISGPLNQQYHLKFVTIIRTGAINMKSNRCWLIEQSIRHAGPAFVEHHRHILVGKKMNRTGYPLVGSVRFTRPTYFLTV